jgi:hypothetical protein
MPLLHRSIAAIHEGELIADILSHPLDHDAVFNIKGIESGRAHIVQQLPLGSVSPKLAGRGDIDIAVIPTDAPDQATAIQVKRFPFRLGVHDTRAGHWKRMAALFAEGVLQANDNAQQGFAQVYLWIFVTIDARERNGGRWTFDGPDPEFLRAPRTDRLHLRLEPRCGSRLV